MRRQKKEKTKRVMRRERQIQSSGFCIEESSRPARQSHTAAAIPNLLYPTSKNRISTPGHETNLNGRSVQYSKQDDVKSKPSTLTPLMASCGVHGLPDKWRAVVKAANRKGGLSGSVFLLCDVDGDGVL